MTRLLALVVLLLAGSADPAGFGRGGGLTCPKGYIGGGLTPCSPRAYFEFAPPDGAGMGAACACTAVTGAKGEPLTLSRTSGAMCLKRSVTSAANGDMVACGNNLPRVMPGGDGSGPMGILAEWTRTNVVPRSQEIDDATFGDFTANGAAAPVLNGADAVPAPDGTVTAEDYTFAATGAPQGSGRAIAVLTAAAYSAQVWVRGVAGGGSMDLCLQLDATPTATCATCAFVTTAWTQCRVENVTSIAGGQVYLGNLSYFNGGIVRASNRVYVWGLDAEAGTYVTSYISTAGAAAARATEVASFPVLLNVSSRGSAAISVLPLSSSYPGPWGPTIVNSSSGRYLYGSDGNILSYDGTSSASVAAGVLTPGILKRFAGSWEDSVMRVYNTTDSTQGTAAFDGTMNPGTALNVCSSNQMGTFGGDAVCKNVCVDPDPARCR